PRIWTTDSLRRAFRHLSLVEQEMRSDINMYQLQHMTPMDAAVRIRTHPSLRVTAKLGRGEPARTSDSGARLQGRWYTRHARECRTLERDCRCAITRGTLSSGSRAAGTPVWI